MLEIQEKNVETVDPQKTYLLNGWYFYLTKNKTRKS